MKLLMFSCFIASLISTGHAQTCNTAIPRLIPNDRYEVVANSNGAEILDKQTRLIWQRCSLGQTWDGSTCTGTATSHKWIDALTKAKSLGSRYRLPNIKELMSLQEEACWDSSINETLFPAMPKSTPERPITPYWSATPSDYNNSVSGSNDNAYMVWYADFRSARTSLGSRITDFYYVRAVRVSQ